MKLRRKKWDFLMEDRKIVRSAGGILSRRSACGCKEVLLVHRTRHRDWGFPKGRIQKEETFEEAALREVWEETGYASTLSEPLPTLRYMDRNGLPKEVYYWNMLPLEPWPDPRIVIPNEEIDQISWYTLSKAEKVLTYPPDRILLTHLSSMEA